MTREVSCGSQHTVVAMASGEVCTFGAGEHGQLGHGDDENSLVPRLLEDLRV